MVPGPPHVAPRPSAALRSSPPSDDPMTTRYCSITNCGKVHVAKGLCGGHYKRVRDYGGLHPEIPLRSLGKENPKTPRAKIAPSREELYWAAGFLDGEGSFDSKKVSASQNDPELLHRLQDIFGGSVNGYKARRATHAPMFYHWITSGSRGRGIMMTLYQLLSTRRKARIKMALAS